MIYRKKEHSSEIECWFLKMSHLIEKGKKYIIGRKIALHHLIDKNGTVSRFLDSWIFALINLEKKIQTNIP